MHSGVSCTELEPFVERWRRQASRCRPGHNWRSQQLVVFGYLESGPVHRRLIAVQHLMFLVLRAEFPENKLTLAGFSGERVAWGVAWGGAPRNRCDKDLTIEPAIGARGARLDLSNTRLVEAAIQLQREFCRQIRFPRLRRRIALPPLWAGFKPSAACRLKGDGPELAMACRQANTTARRLLAETRRRHEGLILLPLDWVSHQWRQMVDVFADIGEFPKRQALRLHDSRRDLIGYRGASEFNFLESRFKRPAQAQPLVCA